MIGVIIPVSPPPVAHYHMKRSFNASNPFVLTVVKGFLQCVSVLSEIIAVR